VDRTGRSGWGGGRIAPDYEGRQIDRPSASYFMQRVFSPLAASRDEIGKQ